MPVLPSCGKTDIQLLLYAFSGFVFVSMCLNVKSKFVSCIKSSLFVER